MQRRKTGETETAMVILEDEKQTTPFPESSGEGQHQVRCPPLLPDYS
jgi:hypothetical protein